VIVSEPQLGGTGVPPVLSEKITRRHLPHWQLAGATYFLTWRCAAGVTLTAAERDIVMAAIRHWDGTRWDVFAAVVMPDHVHVLACPLPKGDGRWELGELLHSVKSFSAHQIAKQRKKGRSEGLVGLVGPASRRSSSIWQDERYDRWMRDEDEVTEKWAYIVGNPVKAGLVEQAEHYRWLYQKMTGGTPVPPTNPTNPTNPASTSTEPG
jgi:REP element-mobilizing transposase RayT